MIMMMMMMMMIIIIIIIIILDKLIKHENIVNYIKALRLSWFGHIQRMPKPGQLRRYLNGIP